MGAFATITQPRVSSPRPRRRAQTPREPIDQCACDWEGCRRCRGLRLIAYRLSADDQMGVEVLASRLGLTTSFAEELLAAERSRRERARIVVPAQVPNRQLRERFEQRQRLDPTFTLGALAREIGASRSNVTRWLGYEPTSATTSRGRRYPPRLLQEIPAASAVRLGRALGIAPVDLGV